MNESDVRKIARREADSAAATVLLWGAFLSTANFLFTFWLLSRPGVLEKLGAGVWFNLLGK